MRHPLVHENFRGLISLVNPHIFEDCLTHAAENLRTQLGFTLKLNPVRLTRSFNEFVDLIEVAQDEDLTPDPPELIDLYGSFCTILNKSNLVSHTEAGADARGDVLDFKQNSLRTDVSSILAVSLTLSLFQDEFIVDYTKCQIERSIVFSLAHRMRRTPSVKVFEIPALAECRYLNQRIYE